MILFEQACFDYLQFRPEHHELAREIARKAAAQACEVSSGRVGRSQKLELEKRVALAVRACIRHEYTDYEFELIPELDKEDYREIKAGAAADVGEFLSQHQ